MPMKPAEPTIPCAPSGEPLLMARDVCFGYGPQAVLHGVSLELHPGELLVLAGPNGAGKSTLLLLLTGYLRPQSGCIRLEGHDIASLHRRQVAVRLAFVPQKSDVAFSFSVTEMVLMGRQPYAGLAALDTTEDLGIVHEALAATGISHLASKCYDQLSGGEQQLVLLARALAQQTPILVLDEPASFLDMRRQWEMMNLLGRLRQEGKTILATFHDLNSAARWASRLALMHQGRIVACGAPSQVLSTQRLEEVYGIPLQVEPTPAGFLRIDFPQ